MDSPPPSIGWETKPFSEPRWKGMWPPLSGEEKALLSRALDRLYHTPPQEENPPLRPLVESCAEEEGWTLSPRQRAYLERVIREQTREAGPLTALLAMGSVEEVSITGMGATHPVRIYDSPHGWMETPLFFEDVGYTVSLLNRMARESGSRLSGETPILNARIPGGMRLHASMAPICQSPVQASIRRFTHRPTHPRELIPTRIGSPELFAYLEYALSCDSNVLVAGTTGSGKTTTLNALAHVFPVNERIVTIEETPELSLAHTHRVSLFPKAGTPYDMPRLIRETLRMRPDRVIIGEIRFPEEARAFMESILSGQGKGTYATFHGHSSHETIARLRQYGILDQDIGWIDVLVIQRRWTRAGKNPGEYFPMRRITEVVELEYDPGFGLTIRPIFTYSPSSDDWKSFPSSRVAGKFPTYFPGMDWSSSLARKANASKGGKRDAGNSYPKS